MKGRIDGNYNLELKLKSTHNLYINNFVAGKCDSLSPAITFLDQDTKSPTFIIDLSTCSKVCDETDFHTNTHVEILNTPMDITFDVLPDPDLKYDHDDIQSQYHLQVQSNFREDYIVKLDTAKTKVVQLALDNSHSDNNKNLMYIKNNLQFDIETYSDPAYTIKNRNKIIHKNNQDTYLQITPINGFDTREMINLPELCTIHNQRTNEVKTLWEMAREPSHDSDTCVNNLVHDKKLGTWRFKLNLSSYYHNTQTLDDEYVLTCNIRVCHNVQGNECHRQMNQCGYEG